MSGRVRRRSCVVGAAACLLLVMGTAGPAARDLTVRVAPGESLGAAIDRAPAGATIFLTGGSHEGPVKIEKELTLHGAPDAVLLSPVTAPAGITVLASGVTIRDLRVEGGETGIHVSEAKNVSLESVSVTGALMEGIDVADAHARIEDVRVHDLASPLAQGIEIRNSEHRGTIVVSGSIVEGGQEGIVAHVSRVRFENNVVRATTMHGVSITEMSRGTATGNVVTDATGAGLYCGDMSLCDFGGNKVETVGASDSTRSGSGWGLLVHYHSSAHSSSDTLSGAAGAIGVFDESHLRDSSALRLGEGWKGLSPLLAVVPISLLALAAAGAAAGRRTRHFRTRGASALRWVTPVALVGLAVQSFHMLEHGLQVYRVYFDGIPSRGGIVGPVVEAEIIHFTYNAIVFACFAMLVGARARGWAGPPRRAADALLGGALLIQGYHVIEHTVKLVQHLITGRRVNPGIAGEFVDLVWLHFGINLAVYAGFAAALVALGLPRLRLHRFGRFRLAAGLHR